MKKEVSKRKNKQYSVESWMIANGKEGDYFYSEKMDKHITAIASHHKRKISTERQLIVTTGKANPSASFITKVTLL